MSGLAFERFLEASRNAEREIVTGDPGRWKNSPFEWLVYLPSRKKGKAAEFIVEKWLRSLGYKVERPISSDHDRVVEGRKVEIKFSTLWEGGDFVFQQLRDQDYEFLIFVGVTPGGALAWIVPKTIASANAISQHGGDAGNDTKWIRFKADNPPPWLDEFGGALSKFEEVLAESL